jgi:hypothetical protein
MLSPPGPLRARALNSTSAEGILVDRGYSRTCSFHSPHYAPQAADDFPHFEYNLVFLRLLMEAKADFHIAHGKHAAHRDCGGEGRGGEGTGGGLL